MADWQPVKDAKVDGTQCALKWHDSLGEYQSLEAYFLHDDGYWYRIEPPTRIEVPPTHFLPLAP